MPELCKNIKFLENSKNICKKFQMLFEQNIASNVTRNQESKHITNLNILKEPPSMPMGPQACPSTQNNYLECKSWRNFIKVLLLSICILSVCVLGYLSIVIL